MLRSPSSINERFFQCYRALYSSRVDYKPVELDTYLDKVSFSALDPEVSAGLESITLEEIQFALLQLQAGKTPGMNVLPNKFYSYSLELFPFLTIFSSWVPSLSLSEAVVLLVLKPGKDPEDCSSYRPISLVNVDTKFLAKILASWLSKVLEGIIHVDLTGFIPGKGTDINLRRLFLNLLSVPYQYQYTKMPSIPCPFSLALEPLAS